MKGIYLTILLTLLAIMMYSQDQTVTWDYDAGIAPGEVYIDIKHLDVTIVPDTLNSSIAGEAVFSFRTLREKTDSMVFYTPAMKIVSVELGNQACRYLCYGSQTGIYPPFHLEKGQDYRLKIHYEGFPSIDCNFIGWNLPRQLKRKEIWAHRPSGWIPYATDRITMDIHIQFDSRYKVFTNGTRISVSPGPAGTSTWHYRMTKDHPFFSTSLVIGNYNYKNSVADDGTPLELWFYPDQEDHFEPTYRYTGKMFGFFSNEFGASYPYELYREAPVIDYTYGAMETTTATVFGDYLHVDPRGFWSRNYVNVNAHELAHQWFGNCLAHLAPRDVWLTESFATYYAKMFEKHIYGEDYYQNERNNELKRTFNAAAIDHYAIGHSRGGVDRWYPKGSLVLDMLRNVMGDADFKSAIKLYFETHSFDMVETSDFITAVYKATGKPLNWFFEEWILRGGEPHYVISYMVSDHPGGSRFTNVSVEQVQETGPTTGLFKMPVDIEIHYTDGTFSTIRPWLENKLHVIPVENKGKKEIAYVLFDPGRKIIKKMTFNRSFDELSAQVLSAPGMIDRYDALLALKSFPLDQKRKILQDAYAKETFHLTKSEIIAQLAGDSLSTALVRKAISDPDVWVRRAVVTYIKQIPNDLRVPYEKLLDDSCYINVEKALENLCASFSGNTQQYLDATKDETGWRGRNIRIKWLETAIMSGQDQFLDELADYATEDYEFETRQNALNAFQRLNHCDHTLAFNLLKACVYWNFRLSGTAHENLKYFYKQNRLRAVIDNVLNDRTQISEYDRQKILKILSN